MENISSRGSEASILTYTATAIQSIGEVDKVVQVQDQSYSKVCPICLEPQLWQEAFPTWWEAGIGCFISRLHHDDRCYFSNRWCVCGCNYTCTIQWFVSHAVTDSHQRCVIIHSVHNSNPWSLSCTADKSPISIPKGRFSTTLHALFGKECI